MISATQILERPASWRTRRGVLIGAGIAGTAVIVTNLLDLRLAHLGVRLMDADSELSWSHLLDDGLFAVALVIAVAGARRASAQRHVWLAMAAIFAVLLADEISPLHGTLGRLSGGKLLYIPILLLLVVCAWRLVRGTPARNDLLLGVAILCASFLMHTLGLHLLRPLGYWSTAYQAAVGVKEGLELAGLIVLTMVLFRLWKARAARDRAY